MIDIHQCWKRVKGIIKKSITKEQKRERVQGYVRVSDIYR